MTKSEQKKFIKSMLKAISVELCDHVTAGKIPENWDGWELRLLIRDAGLAQAMVREPRSKRERDYKNTVLVNGL